MDISSKQSDTNQTAQKPGLFYMIRSPYIRAKNLFNVFFYESNQLTCWIVSINCYILTMGELVVFIDIVMSILL
jgi:hypothetical protein